MIKKIWWNFYSKYITKISFGSKSYILRPMQIDFPKSMKVGNNTIIYDFCWLFGNDSKSNSLIIGDNVRIGHFSHIVATNKVCIKDNVLIADKVFISDTTHNYQDINVAISKQGIFSKKEVVIGENSWIGENVSICGASIGKNSVIGANSVVTKDIPDYCVALGSPAKVIKKYNFKKSVWERI